MTTGAGAAGGGGGGGSVGGSVGGSADAYRQSSSASPRGVVTGGGYCGSSASTPHSHSTNGSYSVANPYTGSPTLYTSRKYISFDDINLISVFSNFIYLILSILLHDFCNFSTIRNVCVCTKRVMENSILFRSNEKKVNKSTFPIYFEL